MISTVKRFKRGVTRPKVRTQLCSQTERRGPYNCIQHVEYVIQCVHARRSLARLPAAAASHIALAAAAEAAATATFVLAAVRRPAVNSAADIPTCVLGAAI